MNTPASTKELRRQLDELGFGDVFIEDNTLYQKLNVPLPWGDCVVLYYYVDEVFPTRSDDLKKYIQETFDYSVGRDREEYIEIGLPNFPYDESWLDDDVDNSKYH